MNARRGVFKKPQNMIVNIFIARFTTCWARLHLYEAFELSGERSLYFDTDLVVV